MGCLALATMFCAACQSEAPEVPVDTEAKTQPWRRFRKAKGDQEQASKDLRAQLESIRSAANDCQSKLVKMARRNLPPEPTMANRNVTEPPKIREARSAAVNYAGVDIRPPRGGIHPCLVRDKVVRTWMEQFRKIERRIPFVPKGMRECAEEAHPRSHDQLETCNAGIVVLNSVQADLLEMKQRIEQELPTPAMIGSAANKVPYLATDRAICVDAARGIEYTTWTLKGVSCQYSRYWVRLDTGEVAGEVTRTFKLAPLKPKAADPNRQELERYQERTRSTARKRARDKLETTVKRILR